MNLLRGLKNCSMEERWRPEGPAAGEIVSVRKCVYNPMNVYKIMHVCEYIFTCLYLYCVFV